MLASSDVYIVAQISYAQEERKDTNTHVSSTPFLTDYCPWNPLIIVIKR